jgi:hypothetical protein
MQARFSHFVVTPEQIEAWKVGFSWIHELAINCLDLNPKWKFHPEFSAPLISGRPDLVIDTGTHLFVIEMKTGFKATKSVGEKQVLHYADDLWGKLKIGRYRKVIPILLKPKINLRMAIEEEFLMVDQPENVLHLSLGGLVNALEKVAEIFPESREFDGQNSTFIKYSPRPSVVEAATSLVAALDDKNVVTGLATSDELERMIQEINLLIKEASVANEHIVIVVSGAPGSGKTLIGLRIAHDPKIQTMLNDGIGTPLYLTGNGPLVEVLTESLARDEVRRLGTSKKKSLSNASAKVRLIHAITEKNIGIESNVIVFDEGQRVWTESHMRFKKKNDSVGSEAYEILSYLEALPWAAAVVLLGEGQEIHTGEAGLITWLEAVEKRIENKGRNWKLVAPKLPIEFLGKDENFKVNKSFHLIANQRTDNAANVSQWVEKFLLGNFKEAAVVRGEFRRFPIYYTRNLNEAKTWLRKHSLENGQSCGLVASSYSKRLINYGVDPAADANRSFNWANWYLNRLPDLNSAAALEVAATEYKCQGLELDWIGVCWSWDLIIDEGEFRTRTLDSGKAIWKKNEKRSNFQINAYRVLMTRARKGMVIWIPEGDDTDSSRSDFEMDKVVEALRLSGISPLDEYN